MSLCSNIQTNVHGHHFYRLRCIAEDSLERNTIITFLPSKSPAGDPHRSRDNIMAGRGGARQVLQAKAFNARTQQAGDRGQRAQDLRRRHTGPGRLRHRRS